jgi:hypothetical protein
MTVKKEAAQTSKKNTAKKDVIVEKKAEKEVIQVKKTQDAKKEAIREVKQISNTQKCANMIMQLAKDAKHTRNEIVQTVSDAISALSIVTVKTMMSDLQNAKYAKRYSSHTIAVDKSTKIVTVASEIKA